jgi:UDP-glucose 4-epimerase
VNANWQGRRVLVTGGAGFLGSGLSLALAQLGASVVAVDALLRDSGANRHHLSGSEVKLVVATFVQQISRRFAQG